MRKFMVIIIVLVIIAAGIPWVDGYFFKQQYLNTIDATNKLLTQQGVVKVLDYRQGWFSSDIRVAYSSNNNGIPATSTLVLSPSWEMMQHVTHGPIIYDHINNRWTLGMAALHSDIDLPVPMVKESVHTDTVVTFLGDYISRSSMPPFSVEVGGAKLNWQGLTLNATAKVLGGEFKYMKADVVVGAFNAASQNGGAIQTQNVAIEYEMVPQAMGIPTGHYSISIPGISLNTPTQGQMTLNNLNFTALINANQDNSVSSQSQLSLGQWQTSTYSITQSSIKLALNNLNGPALMNFANNKPTTPDDYTNAILTLLTPKTSFTEMTAINTSFGRLISDGKVELTAVVKSKQEAIANAKADFNVRVSVSLIDKLIALVAAEDQRQAEKMQQTPSAGQVQPVAHAENVKLQLQDWLTHGYVSHDKDDYVTEITYEQGRLKANGVELSAAPKTAPVTEPAAVAPAPATTMPVTPSQPQ